MSAPNAKPLVLVTGAGGYLGGCVAAFFRANGWAVRELTRAPRAGTDGIRFVLGEDISPASLAGAEALVHCAYDFNRIRWEDSVTVNVAGTEKLLAAAKVAGVKHLIVVSSISAFEGCRSVYGRTKLEIEKRAAAQGAFIVRPGLIYGEPPGAMFGSLTKQVEKSARVPLIGGGGQIQYLVHERDLAGFIFRCAEGHVPPYAEPITLAHEQPWTFRALLEAIGAVRGKKLSFLPMPWRLVWLAMKTAEALGLRLGFRSDSLLSLMFPNPNPSFAAKRRLNIECRPFQPVAKG